MKNLKIVTLLTMALAGLLLVLPSTASASAQLPSGTFDIAFNGFCDGMELTRTGRCHWRVRSQAAIWGVELPEEPSLLITK